jgi:hypothetical protein
MTESEVIPFYFNRGGYECAFSTSLSAVVNNLNNGVILWVHSSHGSESNGGGTLFWDPVEGFQERANRGSILAKIIDIYYKIVKVPVLGGVLSWALQFVKMYNDKNPWRGYEWILGSTEEPDTMSVDLQGMLPYSSIRFPFMPATGQDWVIARRPIREFLNKIIPFFDPFEVDNLYDGVIGTVSHSRFSFKNYVATDIEENLKNLHSAGFITGICQTSNTYFHLMLIRHGSVFQVQDPWPTSWYGAVWRQSIPRDIVLGYTIGEAYTRGIGQVGNLYLSGGGSNGNDPQWWWDDAQGVIYFGDPDLRIFVPSTQYSDANNWEEPKYMRYNKQLLISGHTPYGVIDYPHEQKPEKIQGRILLLIVGFIIILLLFVIFIYNRRRKND